MPCSPPSTTLPSSNSPTLALLHPTPEEKLRTWKLNGSSWRGPLSIEAYLRREEHLASQQFARDGGMTFWILVDTASDTDQRTILASCESFRKRALIKDVDGRVREGVSHGIGSVFCNPDFRGHGYASRMLKELGSILDKWQQKDENAADFTVLYSDIGKKFYSRLGWKAFPSSHITLDTMTGGEGNASAKYDLPIARPLQAEDLPELCAADETALKLILESSATDPTSINVALVPDVHTIRWQHAREEFVANKVLGRWPNVKGSIVEGDSGHRVWLIFTRTFSSEQGGNVLNVLRLVIEGENVDFSTSRGEVPDSHLSTVDQQRVLGAAAIIQSACREAAQWPMDSVQIWNPSRLTILAARKLNPSVKIIDRESESIASLRWHGPKLDLKAEIKWLGNERYGWC